MNIVRWIKSSFEGKDGKASSRKLTTFVAMVMLGITWFCDLFLDLTIDPILLISLNCMIGIGMGYVTAQNIVDAIKGRQNNYFTDDIYQFRRGQNPDEPDERIE